MRLLIVEDEVRLADTLRQLLYRQGYTADVCHDGVSGLDNALTGIYDLVVLDVMLPGMNGFQVAQKLRSANVSTPVLMLTAKSSLDDRVHGLDCGADYYLTKPFGVLEFVSCVKAVLRRCETPKAPRELRLDGLVMNPDERTVTVDDKSVQLTYKEFELLRLFLANPGIAFTRDQLFSRVWGEDFVGETRTIDTHILTLRQKLGSYGERIHTIRNVGYRLEGNVHES